MKLIDSNVVIYYLEKHKEYYAFSRSVIFNQHEEIALSSLSYFEIFSGVLPKDREFVSHFLQSFTLLDVTPSIAEFAAILMFDTQKKSRQVKIDVLIAATALVHHIPLVTGNVKDFEWIEGLQLESLKS